MIAVAKINYKDLLMQVMELRGNAGKSAYKRAKLLVEVYEETDFIVQECQGRADVAEHRLDAYVEDLCLTFLELRDMLKCSAIKPRDWQTGRLKTLHEKMIRAVGEARKKQQPVKLSPTRPTKADVELLATQKLHAEARAAHLERELSQARLQTGDGTATVQVKINGNGVEHFSERPLRVGLVNSFLHASDEERLSLIDRPEFREWCQQHGFEIAPLRRLATAGH